MIRDLTFKKHCRRHSDDVYRYARSMLGNHPDAEDAVQEVLLRLWKHLESIRRQDVRSWLLRTTRNHCIDQIRRRSTSARFNALLDASPDEDAPDPRDEAQCSDFRKLIDAALEQLPENLRSVFVLVDINGLRYREVAQTLEMPINSVKVYLSRARSQLKKNLNRQELCTKI